MADDFEQIGSFLSRWSRRKLEKTGQTGEAGAGAEAGAGPEAAASVAKSDAEVGETSPPEPLPPVESLTLDSDFTPFMQPQVDAGMKSAALKQLFKDPHFNVMDGLDTYIDDYSIADPIPEAMMKTMYQARQHLFSDEEKAQADAADAAQDAAADELHQRLESVDPEPQTAKVDSDPGFPEPLRADSAHTDRKDA